MTQEIQQAGSSDSGAEPTLARPNSISYMQIPAIDAERSADFYESVFGWSIHGRGTSHVSFDDASGYVSGAWVTNRAISREPGVLPYIYVACGQAGENPAPGRAKRNSKDRRPSCRRHRTRILGRHVQQM